VKTPARIVDPEFDLSEIRFGDNDPAGDLKNTKGFDIYVKNTFTLQAIEKEAPFVETKIKRLEDELTVKENIDAKFAAKRTFFQRHFSVFRTREDKTNKHLLNLKKEELNSEEKYSAKLLKTHEIIKESKERFEEVNKTKLEKLNEHVYTLRQQREQKIKQTPIVRASELSQFKPLRQVEQPIEKSLQPPVQQNQQPPQQNQTTNIVNNPK
jgi:hypothetical protein